MESEMGWGVCVMKQKRHSETGGGVARGLPGTGFSQGLQFEITVSFPRPRIFIYILFSLY